MIMKTFIKNFCNKYFVVTSKQNVDYKRKNHDFSFHDMIIIDAYFDILIIAEEIRQKGNGYQYPSQYMASLVELAKSYNCEVIEYESDNTFYFPAFNSIEDATRFKAVIDAAILLNELKG